MHYNKPGSSCIPRLILSSTVVFQLSNFSIASNSATWFVNSSWSPASTASTMDSRNLYSLCCVKLGSSSAYFSNARLVLTMSCESFNQIGVSSVLIRWDASNSTMSWHTPVHKWHNAALNKYSFTLYRVKALDIEFCATSSKLSIATLYCSSWAAISAASL